MPPSHSHCFKHCNTVTVRVFLSQFDGLCCVFVLTETSHPLPPLTQSHTLSTCKTNTCMSYCISGPAQIFTVDSQVLVQSSWLELTSFFPFLRHVLPEKQDKQVFNKGLEGSSSVSDAAYRHRNICTHKKDPFQNHLICCIFHGSRSSCSISGHLISYHLLYIHYLYLAS